MSIKDYFMSSILILSIISPFSSQAEEKLSPNFIPHPSDKTHVFPYGRINPYYLTPDLYDSLYQESLKVYNQKESSNLEQILESLRKSWKRLREIERLRSLLNLCLQRGLCSEDFDTLYDLYVIPPYETPSNHEFEI